MNAERYEALKNAFACACELGPDERAVFLSDLRRRDLELCEEVEALLDHDGWEFPDGGAPDAAQLFGFQPGVDLNDPTDANAHSDDAPQRVPERIGRYRIVEVLAEGGMGVVYVAEQTTPNRLVALKVIRPDLITKSMIRRLQKEAEILGRLQHPVIAQIYEADVAASESSWGQTIRQPFFAMELVRGEPLTARVKNHGLELAEMLDLVARICDGIDYAHQQGVVHRDLKPSNILVDDDGRPRILDFGVARAMLSDTPAATSRTEVGQIIGTLQYMSPEQAFGRSCEVDAQSDVYSLGVILYELIAGRLPHDVQSKSLAGAIHMITDKDAPRLGSIRPECRGDLETIVAKAMEPERAHRYASASDLAADIRRFLRDEPILARPHTAVYQLRKFARRNRGLVGGIAFAAAMLVIGMILTTWFAIKSNRSTKEARWATYKASIAAAMGAQQTGDARDVRLHLESAPTEHRNWEWAYLNAWLDTSMGLLAEDAARESRIAINADSTGVKYLTDSGDIVELQFDSQQREVLCHIDGPAPIRVHDWSRDSGKVAYSTGDHVIHVRDFQTPSNMIRLSDHKARIESARFSHDAAHLISVGRDEGIRVWDLETLEAVHVLDSRSWEIFGAFFSIDGESFYTYKQPEIKQWNTKSGKLMRRLSFQDIAIKHLDLAVDGRHALACSMRRELYWIDLDEQSVETLIGHTARVHAAQEIDGQFVSASADKSIRIWNAGDLSQASIFHGHRDEVEDFAVGLDRNVLVSRGSEGELRLWNLAHSTNPRRLQGHKSYVYPVTFRPDGGLFASGGWDNTVRMWDPVENEQIGTLSGFSGSLIAATFNPRGDRFVTGIRSQMVELFDAITFEQIAHQRCGRSIHAIAYNPDGATMVVSARPDGLYLLNDALEILELRETDETARDLCFRPDGAAVACAYPGSVQVFSSDLAKSIAIRKVDDDLNAVAYSPDGSLLAVGGVSGRIMLFEADSLTLRTQLKRHAGEVYSLLFTGDGTRLLSASEDRSIRFWDIATGESVAELRGHDNYVYALDMSPDGSMLVSTSGDRTIQVWDTLSGPERLKSSQQHRRMKEDAEAYISEQFQRFDDLSQIAAHLRSDAELPASLRSAVALMLTRRSAARRQERVNAVHFPRALNQNATGAADSLFVGPPDGRSFSLGRESVTYDLRDVRVVDGKGPDLKVFEVDTGDSSFGLIDVLISADGVHFESVKASEAPVVRFSVAAPREDGRFSRSYDLSVSPLRRARFIRVEGTHDHDIDPGDWPSFDLDTVGLMHFEGASRFPHEN